MAASVFVFYHGIFSKIILLFQMFCKKFVRTLCYNEEKVETCVLQGMMIL